DLLGELRRVEQALYRLAAGDVHQHTARRPDHGELDPHRSSQYAGTGEKERVATSRSARWLARAMVSPSTWTLIWNGGAWPCRCAWALANAIMFASSCANSLVRPAASAAAGIADVAASERAAVLSVPPIAAKLSSVRTSVESGDRFRRSRLAGKSASGILRRSLMTKSAMASNTALMARPTPRKKSTTGDRKPLMPSAMERNSPMNHRPMPTKNWPIARKKL